MRMESAPALHRCRHGPEIVATASHRVGGANFSNLLSHSIFLAQSELDALLSEQPSKKRPLPKSKIPELVAALRKLDNLPNREKQREALRKLPEFEQYHLTDHVLREAERRAPRDPGRKRLPPEE